MSNYYNNAMDGTGTSVDIRKAAALEVMGAKNSFIPK
jgi:hypothetical protein